MDFYKGAIPIIDRDADFNTAFLGEPGVIRGGMVRPDDSEPPVFGDAPSDITVISEADWDAIFDEAEQLETSLEHKFLPNGVKSTAAAFTNLDQNGFPHCWAYDAAHAKMMCCLRDGMPVPRFNPNFIACMLGRLDGGWGALAAKFIGENGCPVQGSGPGEMPYGINSKRQITQAMIDAAKRYAGGEQWYNTSREAYDQELAKGQYASALMRNQPCPSDWNFAGHSMLAIRWVRLEKGSYAPLVLNTWKGWGFFGLGVIRGRYTVPDGSCSMRTPF